MARRSNFGRRAPATRRQQARIASGKSLSSVTVTGFDELRDQLKNLSRATEKGALRRASKTALQPMLDYAVQTVPVREGTLKASIRLVVGMDDPGYRARARASFRARGHARGVKRTRGGGNIVASIRAGGAGARHASFVEFGTVKMSAEPFLRPAFDAESGTTLERLRAALQVEVRKAIERKAKRDAKKLAGG